jgi:hypothetical protein
VIRDAPKASYKRTAQGSPLLVPSLMLRVSQLSPRREHRPSRHEALLLESDSDRATRGEGSGVLTGIFGVRPLVLIGRGHAPGPPTERMDRWQRGNCLPQTDGPRVPARRRGRLAQCTVQQPSSCCCVATGRAPCLARCLPSRAGRCRPRTAFEHSPKAPVGHLTRHSSCHPTQQPVWPLDAVSRAGEPGANGAALTLPPPEEGGRHSACEAHTELWWRFCLAMSNSLIARQRATDRSRIANPARHPKQGMGCERVRPDAHGEGKGRARARPRGGHGMTTLAHPHTLQPGSCGSPGHVVKRDYPPRTRVFDQGMVCDRAARSSGTDGNNGTLMPQLDAWIPLSPTRSR